MAKWPSVPHPRRVAVPANSQRCPSSAEASADRLRCRAAESGPTPPSRPALYRKRVMSTAAPWPSTEAAQAEATTEPCKGRWSRLRLPRIGVSLDSQRRAPGAGTCREEYGQLRCQPSDIFNLVSEDTREVRAQRIAKTHSLTPGARCTSPCAHGSPDARSSGDFLPPRQVLTMALLPFP